GKTSVLATGRISHADWFLRKVSNPDVRNSSAFFYDAFASVSHRFSENSSAELIYYASKDDFAFAKQFEYSWDNQIINARWQGLANRKASPSVSLSYGQYRSILVDPAPPEASELTMTMRYFKCRTSVNYMQDDRHNAVQGGAPTGYIPRP